MERPLKTLGFSFFLSLILASFLKLKMIVVFATLCLLALLTGICVRSIRQNKRVMTVIFAAMAAFSMYAGQEMFTYRPLQKWNGKQAHLRVETMDWVRETDSRKYVKTRVLDGELPKGTRLTFWIRGNELYPEPYDILEGDFTLKTPSDCCNGQIRGYSKSQKIFLNSASANFLDNGIIHKHSDTRPWMFQILRMRRYVKMTLLSQPGMDDVSGLMSSVAFGFHDVIPTDVKYNFRLIGVSHLLAVSGLHTALFGQALLALLLFLRIPRRLASGIAAGGVLFFMALTGFSPSVVRAGIMSIIYFIGMLLGRQPDSLNSLGLAVLIITIINPYAVNDAGLLLSFAATFGLIVLYPPIQRVTSERLRSHAGFTRFFARPVQLVCVTFSATIPTLPIILLAFGQISIVSPLSNLLMVFPASAVMITTCLGALFSAIPFLRFLAIAAFWAGKWLSRYLVVIAGWLASLPMASVRAQQPFLFVCVSGAMILIFLGWKWFKLRGIRVMALWSVIALLCGMLSYGIVMHGVTKITVINSGNASAVLLERDGRAGLIIMGDSKANTASLRTLNGYNIRTLDFLMIPDLNSDCAFCPMTLTDKIEVDCLITGPKGKYYDTVQELPISGKRLTWDEGTITFWNDCRAVLAEGWLYVTVNKTRLLVCPTDGNAASLTEQQRLTNLIIFTAVSPLNVSAFTAQAGVLSCSEYSRATAMKTAPHGVYPLRCTADGDVLLFTRGQGDITFRKN